MAPLVSAEDEDKVVASWTSACEFRSTLPKASIELNSLPKNRRVAAGCPLSALGTVSGIEPPFLTGCAMKAKSLLSRKMQLAFGSVILTLLVAGAISYWGIVVRRESDRLVRYTQVRKLQDEALRESWRRQ